MDDFKSFWNNNQGTIIGVIVAVILLITKLHDLVIALILIIGCGFIGNYIYKNKTEVKDKLKKFIDKMVQRKGKIMDRSGARELAVLNYLI